MSLFLRIDINIVAIILLGIVFVIARRRLDKNDSLNKAFFNISVIILIQLFIETCTCILNGHSKREFIQFSYILHICLLSIAPFLTYKWYVFIENMVGIGKSSASIRKLLLIPVVINAILAILSPHYNLIFYIDSSYLYHRGQLFILTAAITYFYFIYGLVLVIKQRRRLAKQEFILLHIFAVLSMLGGLFQSIFYGILLMWSSVAFSLIIVYIYLQQRMVNLDDLTGAWSRSFFEYYVSNNIRHGDNKKMGIIYVDIDGLKRINDIYGHIEGDHAIKIIIEIIKNLIRKSDFIVRMGGDEFLIVLNCELREDLENTIDRIQTSLSEYNESSEKEYKLECSFGADIFDSRYDNIEKFIHHIDTLMYENKKNKTRC